MNKLSLTLLSSLSVLLIACNGGGGGGTPTTCYTCSSPSGSSSSTYTSSGSGSSSSSSSSSSSTSTSSSSSTSGSGSSSSSTTVVTSTPIIVTPAVSTVDRFVNLLHDHYNYLSDDNFFVVKDPSQTLTEGFVVVYDWDIGKYIAYDLQNFQAGDSWSTYTYNADYQPVSINDSYVDYWGETFYIGDAFDFFGFYQGEFVFEENGEGSKDLEKVSALMESYKVEKMGVAMASEFGLSETRGIEIAKMATQMQKLLKKRSLTDQDAKAFSKEILGVDFAAAEKALLKKFEGSDEEFDSLLQEAAKANEVSPEHMNKIINDLFING